VEGALCPPTKALSYASVTLLESSQNSGENCSANALRIPPVSAPVTVTGVTSSSASDHRRNLRRDLNFRVESDQVGPIREFYADHSRFGLCRPGNDPPCRIAARVHSPSVGVVACDGRVGAFSVEGTAETGAVAADPVATRVRWRLFLSGSCHEPLAAGHSRGNRGTAASEPVPDARSVVREKVMVPGAPGLGRGAGGNRKGAGSGISRKFGRTSQI